MKKYKPIPKTFTRYGDHHKLVTRDGNFVIYERTSGITGEVTHHEVMIVRMVDAGESFGKKFPDHEALPGPSQWGSYAWTVISGLEKAKVKMSYEMSKRGLVKTVRKRTRRSQV
jgi:hypothetical protein